MHDILIRGGTLFDGAGSPGAAADLAIAGGRIAAIDLRGRDSSAAGAARKVIDAQGLAVAPGFIDVKTHSDFTLPFRELSFPDYLTNFPATAVNAGMLVGHNTLRLMVMGMAARAPSGAELAQMIALLENALGAGALGLSSGLFTPPGSYAQPAEMIALGHVLKRHNAGYFTHLRDESNKVIEAVAEAIDLAGQCGVHVEIVHFKCSGMDNWGKAATALAMIADAKARGLDVDCDAYPYAAGSNPLKNLLPQWVQAGGTAAMIARLAERDTREKIRADIARDGLNNWGRIPSWDCVQISISPHLPQHAGRTIASLAGERGADPVDTLCDFLIDDRAATRVLVTAISEDDIRTIVASPLALVGSDGNCVAPYGAVGQGLPHPRFYGTFPRILSRYVREQNALPLELAIHKMTGATARALKLKDRGLLRQGFRADIVLFDPEDFADRATYADPHQFPSGPRTTVIVNGTIVVENATHTGALPGMVLRRDGAGAVG